MRSGGSTCAPAVPGAYVPDVVVNVRYVWWHMAGVVRANSDGFVKLRKFLRHNSYSILTV